MVFIVCRTICLVVLVALAVIGVRIFSLTSDKVTRDDTWRRSMRRQLTATLFLIAVFVISAAVYVIMRM